MSTHDYDPKRVSVTVGGVPIRSASVDMRIEADDEPPARPFSAGMWSHTLTLNSAEVNGFPYDIGILDDPYKGWDGEAARAAAHPDDVRLVDAINAKIMADIKRSFDALLPIDEMFLSDGRAHRRAPRDVCSWCCADRYDPATGRCSRCNEPWYDGVLAWPGPSTATLTPCALRFGGGSISPSDHLSVVNRMIMHRGLRSELAREIKWQRLCPTRTENV